MTTTTEVSKIEHKAEPTRQKRKRVLSDTWYSILLIVPAMLIIGFFALFPLFYAINLALRYADLTSPIGIGDFVGLDNFRFALNDQFFWNATRVTVIFTVAAVTIEMVLGIAIAFLLHGAKWFKGILRSVLLLPLAAAPAAVGLIWRYMYHPEFGVIGYYLNNLPMLKSLIGQDINMLGNLKLALPSVIIFDIWQWTPFVALIVLAGLQSLPKEPFEAAELDGAPTLMVLRRLTFPMLTPVLTLVFLLRTIDALRLYDAVYSLTRGGPGTATETLTFYLYRLGLVKFRMDRASAIALLFLYVSIIITIIALRWLSRYRSKQTVMR
ncbi:MAG: sugar ABC transporter permease [Anaerolineales bacterium]